MSPNTERNAEIIRRRKAGEGVAEIGRTLGLSRQLVSGVCWRAGLAKPTRGRGNAASDEFCRLLRKLAESSPKTKLARDFGCSRGSIYRWIARAA